MDTQSKAKDFFINLGAIVALYTSVVSLLNLLFTVINTAYPQVTNGYTYFGSSTISWPVATLIIFFPIFMFLMWLLEKDYIINPSRQNSGIHRWLTYITLFITGLVLAIDLITVLYYFLDGQELTTGFVLKVLVLLVVASGIFSYYLYDVLGKLTSKNRNTYRIVACLVILLSIVWGFSVLGSPRTQRLYKYDEQKVNDLMNINNEINNFYSINGKLPTDLFELSENYYLPLNDGQTDKPYEYLKKENTKYTLCAEFNRDSAQIDEDRFSETAYPYHTWVHKAGKYCFDQTVNPNTYLKPSPMN
ncbi:hypothetical protein HZA26_02795 [Candidatus Nomurabacteria bacterium]|nr:hypothetical protein [Candidatus Nomurabacteria bacterium]